MENTDKLYTEKNANLRIHYVVHTWRCVALRRLATEQHWIESLVCVSLLHLVSILVESLSACLLATGCLSLLPIPFFPSQVLHNRKIKVTGIISVLAVVVTLCIAM